jgi:hypothetical protein
MGSRAPPDAVSSGDDAHEEVEDMKNAGLHALNWGLQGLGIVLAVFFVALLAVAVFVTVLVAIQAAAAFGQ